jgi:hypothetical protein
MKTKNIYIVAVLVMGIMFFGNGFSNGYMGYSSMQIRGYTSYPVLIQSHPTFVNVHAASPMMAAPVFYLPSATAIRITAMGSASQPVFYTNPSSFRFNFIDP